MAYEVDDDFEDARGYGIDPDKAKRANRMYRRWMAAINEEFPDALNKADPEERDIVMMGFAAILGEFAGLISISADRDLAEAVLKQKYELSLRKMEIIIEMAKEKKN